MIFQIYKFLLLSIGINLIALPLKGQFRFAADFRAKNTEVCKTLESFAKIPGLKGSSWGLAIVNPKDGKFLAEKSAADNFIPASNMKIITSLNAFHHLGEDYRFSTDFYISGSLKDSVLYGNIWISGGGDPTPGMEGRDRLNSDFFGQAIRLLKSRGIKSIKGRLIQIPCENPYHGLRSTWSWGDLSQSYGAGIYALNANENQFHIYADAITKDSIAVIKRADSLFSQMNLSGLKIKTGPPGSNDDSYFSWKPGSSKINLTGTIPPSSETQRLRGAIPDPEQFFLDLLKHELWKGGVMVRDSIVEDQPGQKIGEIKSPPLSQIIKEVNQHSNNFYTEALAFALCRKGDSGSDYGWTHLNRIKSVVSMPEGYYLSDGSGLSPTNRLSPAGITKALSWALKQKWSETFLSSLPVAGESGTMKNFCTGACGKIRAKSGTLNRTLCYSGYAETASGKVIFSMMINNYHGGQKSMKEEMGKVLESFVKIRH